MRGSRVQSVVNELSGEKIDIVNWVEDPAALVVSALAPAEIQKVIIDEQNKKYNTNFVGAGYHFYKKKCWVDTNVRKKIQK